MKPELKKLLVLNLPYLLFVYLFAKCGQAISKLRKYGLITTHLHVSCHIEKGNPCQWIPPVYSQKYECNQLP